MVRSMVKSISSKQVALGVDPALAMGLGAALQGEMSRAAEEGRTLHIGGEEPRISDVTSHALGVITVDSDLVTEVNSVVIPREAIVPAKVSTAVATVSDQQRTMRIRVTQGHDPGPRYVTVVGTKELPLTPYPKGAEFQLTCVYDIDQVVSVELFDLTAHTRGNFRGRSGRIDVTIRRCARFAQGPTSSYRIGRHADGLRRLPRDPRCRTRSDRGRNPSRHHDSQLRIRPLLAPEQASSADDSHDWVAEAQEFARMGMWSQAHHPAGLAARSDPDNPEIWRLQGLYSFKLNRRDEAERCYNQAMMLAPNDPFYALYLVDFHLDLDRKSEAARLQPSNDDYRYELALAMIVGVWTYIGDITEIPGEEWFVQARKSLDRVLELKVQDSRFPALWKDCVNDIVTRIEAVGTVGWYGSHATGWHIISDEQLLRGQAALRGLEILRLEAKPELVEAMRREVSYAQR